MLTLQDLKDAGMPATRRMLDYAQGYQAGHEAGPSECNRAALLLQNRGARLVSRAYVAGYVRGRLSMTAFFIAQKGL
jgi:hypothetical protein